MPPRKSRKGMKNQIDYVKLKQRFMQHEWATLDQMAKANGLSANQVYQKCGGWGAERRALESEVEVETRAIFIQDMAQMRADMLKRQMMLALALQEKGSKHLLAKFIGKNGTKLDVPFESDSIALGALRLGVGMEQGLLRRQVDDPPGGAAQILDVGDGTADSYRAQIRTITNPQELLKLMESLDADADDGRKAKADSGRSGAASGGKNKRS